MTEPELWECEVCGRDCRPGEPYCGFECADIAVGPSEDEEANDEPPCHHSPSAWRSCDHCKSVVGDLQYQRMKEGELD